MDGLIGSLFGFIGALLAEYWPWLVAAAVALLIGCFALNQLIRLYGRWSEAGGIRRPLSFMPLYLYRQKEKLLASRIIREGWTPSQGYMDELPEGKRPTMEPSWLHRYGKALKATVKDNRASARTKQFRAGKQISDLARWVTVSEVPPFVSESDDPREAFWIELEKDGTKTDEQLEGLKGYIKNTLRVQSVEPYPTKNTSVASFLVKVKEVKDPLTELKPGREFFEENAAEKPTLLALAMDKAREIWFLAFHHLLIFGTTGSGKGSPIQGIIWHLAHFVARGQVILFGIDPKGTELDPYTDPAAKTPIFKRISMGVQEEDLRAHATTIAQVMAVLDERMKNKKTNLDKSKGKVDLGRSFTPSKRTPMVVLIIDEYFALRTQLQNTLKGEAKKPLSDLDTILAMGRSFGIFAVLATQFADKENLGNIRDNLPNRIVLRHEASDYITTMLLGDDALELGHNPRAIPPANPANGYATAGIGFAKDQTGVVKKVRFAYLSDDDIADLVMGFRMEDEEENGNDSEEEPLPLAASEGQPTSGPRYSSIQRSLNERSEW